MANEEITRRTALGLAAGAVATAFSGHWVFAVGPQGGVVKTAADGSEWKPVLFDERQAEGLAHLVEAIIPRTDTPGARDARVHEYIDLAVSVEDAPDRQAFVDGFVWLDESCRRLYSADLAAVGDDDLIDLLSSVSDEHDELAGELAIGGAFFSQLKRRTIFGYYTSLEGRVQELGLPEVVSSQVFRGCRHTDGHA